MSTRSQKQFMSEQISYWVDSNYIIRKVDINWDNQMGPDSWSIRASSKAILGKPLFEFIADDVTRMFVGAILDSVRVLPRTLTRPYRCDSPDAKRFMQMTVSPEANGLIKVSHELIRSEPLAQEILFKTVQGSNGRVRGVLPSLNISHFERPYKWIRCSLCNRLQDPDNKHWQEVDQLQSTMRLNDQPIPVIYGVCPNCIDSMHNIIVHDFNLQ